MRQLFISYARENKPDVEVLVQDLDALGYPVWVDSSVRGGQTWWEEILRRIAECDVFIPIVSRDALSSEACKREFDWAEALGKPALPVAVERIPKALPSRYSRRQIVDYSQPGKRAALTLAGGLDALPQAPSLPTPLPDPPRVPLSYLTELIDAVSVPEPLSQELQRQIVDQLAAGLRSHDPDERQGARDILDRLRSRRDLDEDINRIVGELTDVQTTLPEHRSLPDEAAFAATLTESEPRPGSAQLVGADGHGVVIPADGLRIGRMPDNDLIVANPKASRHHAVIVSTPDGFILRDLGSANGTYVGDTKLLESHLLKDGDEIRMCDQSWRFERLESPED